MTFVLGMFSGMVLLILLAALESWRANRNRRYGR